MVQWILVLTLTVETGNIAPNVITFSTQQKCEAAASAIANKVVVRSKKGTEGRVIADCIQISDE
jgi:hypothetical protein